jgi:hypothetical protein
MKRCLMITGSGNGPPSGSGKEESRSLKQVTGASTVFGFLQPARRGTIKEPYAVKLWKTFPDEISKGRLCHVIYITKGELQQKQGNKNNLHHPFDLPINHKILCRRKLHRQAAQTKSQHNVSGAELRQRWSHHRSKSAVGRSGSSGADGLM